MNNRISETISICDDYQIEKSVRCRSRLAPHHVYTISENDIVLYVGMTVNVRSRMYGHKARSYFWSDKCVVSIETMPTRRSALKREKELIKTMKPAFNIMHNG